MMDRCGPSYCALIRNAFLCLATSNVAVFHEERETASAVLQDKADSAWKALRNILGDDMKRPNSHTTQAHVVDGADMFSVAKNFDCRTLETKDAPFASLLRAPPRCREADDGMGQHVASAELSHGWRHQQ